MNRVIKSSLVMLCVALPTVFACSQVPPPPPPAGGPPVAGPLGRRPPRPPVPGAPDPANSPGARPLQQLVTIQGRVQAFTASDSIQYDGLSLKGNEQTVNVRFAPTMAAQLMAAAKVGTPVSLQGFYETTPDGINVVHLVTATINGQTIYDNPPAEPVTPPTATMQQFEGTIADLRLDRGGMPNGLILSGNRVVDLPPGVYAQMQSFLRPGVAISGSGSSVPPPAGVVLTQNVQTIHPQLITVNGQTYMVR
jgi:hypothetical protein